MSKVLEYHLLMQELEEDSSWVEHQENMKLTEEDFEEMANGA